MKINHSIIRESIKWFTFILFAISVGIKIKAILEHGGVKPINDPNEDIVDPDEGPIPEEEDYEDYADEVYAKEPAISESYGEIEESAG